MKTYEIKNNKIVINYGNNTIGNACTPVDLVNDGHQYDVSTPTTNYTAYDWSCVEVTTEHTRPQVKLISKTKKRSFIKRLFGIR